MIRRFADKYRVTSNEFTVPPVGLLRGSELCSLGGGTVFWEGFFRIYTPDQSAAAAEVLHSVYPEQKDRFEIFGGDWLGRMWATGRSEVEGSGKPIVRVIDPEHGVLVVPGPLFDFFDQLAELGDGLFVSDVYTEWHSARSQDLAWDECVALQVPEALGGDYSLANLKVTDLSVHWGLASQIGRQLADVQEGQAVDVSMSSDQSGPGPE